MFKYEPRQFPNLSAITAIPPQEFEEHLKLYAGYVTNCNVYREKIAALIDGAQTGTPEYQAMMRRLGFEYDGMILHEYYFDSLSIENNSLDSAPALKSKIEVQFGSVEKFIDHYKKVAMMRGIGWACLYQDAKNDQISVHFVGEHENGHPAGFNLLMAVDAWEHAWTAYLKPTEKAKYVEDIFTVIDWKAVEGRLR